jgi:hypothetical protein
MFTEPLPSNGHMRHIIIATLSAGQKGFQVPIHGRVNILTLIAHRGPLGVKVAGACSLKYSSFHRQG